MFCIVLCFSYFLLVLPPISILSVLNKLIRIIFGGVKQARTQGSMFWTKKFDFEPNTHDKR